MESLCLCDGSFTEKGSFGEIINVGDRKNGCFLTQTKWEELIRSAKVSQFPEHDKNQISSRIQVTVSLFEGSINSDVFGSWVRQDLLPKLPSRCVLVMDNATFHKRKDTLKVIESAGHTVLFQPPYSPDLNKIEKKWAQCKKIRQRLGCDPETLFECHIIWLFILR